MAASSDSIVFSIALAIANFYEYAFTFYLQRNLPRVKAIIAPVQAPMNTATVPIDNTLNIVSYALLRA